MTDSTNQKGSPLYRPMVLTVSIFIGGILRGHSGVGLPFAESVASIVLAFGAVAARYREKKRLSTLMLLIAVFLWGSAWISSIEGYLPASHVIFTAPSDEVTLVGWIYLPIEQTDKGFKLFLELCGIETAPGAIELVTGKVVIHVAIRDDMEKIKEQLRYGAWIRVETALSPPSGYFNAGGFDQAVYFSRKDIYLTGYLGYPEFLTVLQRSPGYHPLKGIFDLRDEWLCLIEQNVKPWFPEWFTQLGATENQVMNLSKALLIGDRSGIDDDMKIDFQKTGLVHLLAISGMHFAIVAGMLSGIFRLFPFGYRVQAIGVIGSILLYSIITGGSASVVRSALTILLYMLGRILNRPVDVLNILAISAFILLIVDPRNLFDVGFQLTYSATLGIITLTSPLDSMLRWISWRWLRQTIAVSLAAQLAVSPLSAYLFNRISGWGFLPFIPLAPVVSLGLITGLMGSLVAFFPFLSVLLLRIHAISLGVIVIFADWVSQWPGVTAILPTPSIVSLSLFIISLGLLAVSARYPVTRWISVVVFILVVVGEMLRMGGSNNERLTIHFLDVGNGDCIVVQCPSGENILIDSGGVFGSTFDIGRNVVTPTLRHLGVDCFEIALITHPHPDHQLGMASIIDEFSIRELWVPSIDFNDLDLSHIIELAKKKQIPVRELDDQDIFKCLKLDTNNRSLVLGIEYGNCRIMLPGDAEHEAELGLLDYGNWLHSDILKAGHHGSRTSSSQEFLERVSPQAMIITCGRNNQFGHPHRIILDRVASMESQIDVFRSDQCGMISVTTNGYELECHTTLFRY